MGEVCIDAACAGSDLGKKKIHHGDMFSPLTVHKTEIIHPKNASGAQGNTGAPTTGSEEQGNNATQLNSN